MKLQYTKPNLNIELFSLCQTIAAGCGAVHNGGDWGSPNHWSKSTCGWKDSAFGDIVYTSAPICDTIVDENTDNEGYCYNAPSAGNAVFSS